MNPEYKKFQSCCDKPPKAKQYSPLIQNDLLPLEGYCCMVFLAYEITQSVWNMVYAEKRPNWYDLPLEERYELAVFGRKLLTTGKGGTTSFEIMLGAILDKLARQS